MCENWLTKGGSGVDRRQEEGGGDPGYPAGDGDDHQEEYWVSFFVVILDVFILDGEDTHEDDEKEYISEGEDVVTGLIATERPETNPLQGDNKLHQDGEEQEEGLVHGWEVDPGVERDEEDKLH